MVSVLVPRKEEGAAALTGKCFVMFATPAGARKAVNRLDKQAFGGKRLRASLVADLRADPASEPSSEP